MAGKAKQHERSSYLISARGPAAVDGNGGAGDLRGGVGRQEDGGAAQLFRRDKLQRGLLFAEQFAGGGFLIHAVLLGQRGDLLLDQRVRTQPGQMALAVMPWPAVSSAVTLVKPTTPCLAAT